MAYQNVGTPRFYVDLAAFNHATGFHTATLTDLAGSGMFDPVTNVFGLNPHSPILYTGLGYGGLDVKNFGNTNYLAILGHSGLLDCHVDGIDASDCSVIVNSGLDTFYKPSYSGFSIHEFPVSNDDVITVVANIDSGGYIGAISIGTYYDMPHSPDLKLTMTREMDGVKRIRTKGGADLVDHKYTKPPLWGDAAPWELYSGTETSTQSLSRTGRRTWSLSFSYLADSDIFPDVSSLHNYETTSPDGVVWNTSLNLTNNTLLNEDTFYSQVIHKTNGGQLPFIFQPDKNDLQFAICKFDMNTFQFKQVANGVYNVKLKIREVW